MKTNLHIHTTVSDGRNTVEEVVNIMHSAGIEMMSITDHDRLDANSKAKEIATRYGIRYLNGIEISVSANGLIESDTKDLSLHLLGYGFDLDSLESINRKMDIHKVDVALRLYHQLIRDGYVISYDPQSGILNRTLIARLLIQAKYASSLDEAFQSILDLNYSKYRIPKLDPNRAISMVHEAGGIVVWAHPHEIISGVTKMRIDHDQVESIVKQLKGFGLDGLEARYAKYDMDTISLLEDLASKYALCVTTGSDFHGKSDDEYSLLRSPVLEMGIQCNQL